MGIVKIAIVALLLLFAVVCVYDGMGFEFPWFDFMFFDNYGVLVGIASGVVAMLLAKYWDVARDLN